MSPIFRLTSELCLWIYLNTNWLHRFRSHFCHNFRHKKTWNDLVTNSRPRRSFLGLISVLNPIGLDTKKPRNYLIVRGLSRIFRFSSEVHSGAGGHPTPVVVISLLWVSYFANCSKNEQILRTNFVLLSVLIWFKSRPVEKIKLRNSI